MKNETQTQLLLESVDIIWKILLKDKNVTAEEIVKLSTNMCYDTLVKETIELIISHHNKGTLTYQTK